MNYQRSVTAIQKSDVRIECEVEGIPPPTISWQKNFIDIQTGGNFKVGDDGTLTISNVKVWTSATRNHFLLINDQNTLFQNGLAIVYYSLVMLKEIYGP